MPTSDSRAPLVAGERLRGLISLHDHVTQPIRVDALVAGLNDTKARHDR
jgi:hypothetical protein